MQTYPQLCTSVIKSITIILYDEDDEFFSVINRSHSFDILDKNPLECLELVKEMEFGLVDVYHRCQYRNGMMRPSDWIKRIRLAMDVRDRLEARYDDVMVRAK